MESGNASTENNNVNDIGLINFLDEDNFEQFIELIRGETADPIVKFCPNYDCEHMTGCFSAANAQFEPILSSMDFYDTTLPDPISLYNCEIKLDNNDDDDDDDDGSSGTTATTKMTPTSKGTRTDRSRTLISERKRRGRMKEKLYALRSLVPNITKMDKASIIGDAILYVQGLQTKAKKLKVEIAEFESSINQSGIFQNAKKMNFTTYYPAIKRITKMDINQVEEKGFYVRLICNKGRHIAASLFKALESLNGFNVQTSNLATSTNDYIFTFTLNVRECHEVDINFGNLKLWIASAFLNQGFDFETSPLV